MNNEQTRPDLSRISRVDGRLTAVHTLEGKYVYVHKKSFEQVNVNIDELIDRKWQDFVTSGTQLELEREAIDKAVAEDSHIYLSGVRRRWGSRILILNNKITVVRSRRGTKLILREAAVVGEQAISAEPGPDHHAGLPSLLGKLLPGLPPNTHPATVLDLVSDHLVAAHALLSLEEHQSLLRLIETALYMTGQKRDRTIAGGDGQQQ